MFIYSKGTYIFAWTPYAIITFYVAFIGSDEALETLSPIGMTLPAIFAKSSILLTPISIIMTNTKIKEKLKNYLGYPLKEPNDIRIGLNRSRNSQRNFLDDEQL
jgi:hypothetical protein